MPRYVNIEPLEKDFQERFNYLFDKSQTKVGEDKWLIDESIQNAAVIAKEFLDKTKRLPTADVQEVKHATKGLHVGDKYYCSNCGRLVHCANYCEICGAKIDSSNGNIPPIQPDKQPNISYDDIKEKLLSGAQDLAKEICEIICPEIDHEEDETACGLIMEYIKSQIEALK